MAVATEPESQLRCPRCGARLAPEQDWCLECGTAATTRVLGPPSWKLAAGVILGIVALVAIAVALVVSALSGDAKRAVAKRTGARRAAPAAAVETPASTTSTAASSTTATGATSTGTTATGAATSRALATWPTGRQAWTVVLASAPTRAKAQDRARSLAAAGVKAGVLDGTSYTVSGGGSFVVFTGVFDSQDAAVAEEGRLGAKAPSGSYVAQVSPR